MISVNYHNSPIPSLFLHRVKSKRLWMSNNHMVTVTQVPPVSACKLQFHKCLVNWCLLSKMFLSNFPFVPTCNVLQTTWHLKAFNIEELHQIHWFISWIKYSKDCQQMPLLTCANSLQIQYIFDVTQTCSQARHLFFYTWMNGSYWKIAFTNCGLSSPHFWRGRGSGHVFCVRGRGVILLDRRLHADVYEPGDRHPTERLFIAGVLQGIGDPANVSPHLVQLLHTQRKKNKERLGALLFHWQCCLHFKVSLKTKGCFLKVDSIKMQITAFSVRNAVFSPHKRRKNFPHKHHKAFQSIKAHHTKASKGGHRKLAVKSWRGMTVTNVIIYFVSSSSVHRSQHVRAELYILLLFSVQKRNER